VVLGVALVLRLGWGMTRPAGLAALPDQEEYLALGRNLLHQGALYFHDGRFDQDVYAYRTPGYPVFIAMLGGSVRSVRVAQALIDTSTVLAVWMLARRWMGGRSALAAGILVALNPLLIYFSGLILSETLYTALLAWGVWLATTRQRWVAGVVVLALGAMVRPAGIGLVVVVPMVAGWMGRGWRTGLLRGVIGAGVLLMVFGIWADRNQRVLGQKVWVTTNEGITRYDGFNERADGSSNQWFVKEMPRLRDMDELQRDDVLSQMAAAYVAEHPGRVLELAGSKIARTWSPWPLSEQFGSAKYILVGVAYSVPLFGLALLGLASRRIKWLVKVMLATPALYFTVVHALSVGSLRYRVPAEPELAVIAAAAGWINKRDDGTKAETI
jgi:4-amino-4-deoxy-L-arabinose transferase-like glycosyltransferase